MPAGTTRDEDFKACAKDVSADGCDASAALRAATEAGIASGVGSDAGVVFDRLEMKYRPLAGRSES